jgi:hypothetical protein
MAKVFRPSVNDTSSRLSGIFSGLERIFAAVFRRMFSLMELRAQTALQLPFQPPFSKLIYEQDFDYRRR